MLYHVADGKRHAPVSCDLVTALQASVDLETETAKWGLGGEWPQDHPLPLPQWDTPRVALTLPTVEAYEELALTVELTVQQLISAHKYNTVGNFVRFYQAYKRSRETSLRHFYRGYKPVITEEHHTCVGLGIELLRRLSALDSRFPGLSNLLYLVSCEEAVDNADLYVSEDPDPRSTEKEHVLVALKLLIAGRPGILLLDPGYHVARVVTVMADEMYPHTGWFTQSKEGDSKKDYNYSFAPSKKYVIWRVREKRGLSPEKMSHSVIYIERPFKNAVNVAERRNLVYNFRSLLQRDTKGHLTAGIYFPISESGPNFFTIFYQENGSKRREKLNFNLFKNTDTNLDPGVARSITLCNKQLGLKEMGLSNLLHILAQIISDNGFISQVLSINQDIIDMADDN
ncbi:uncharacterized protein LOC142317887 [Lycorma delicatula]|uniref:uncharacterized protein LOC142317887 n=1 Tax=Lycorma delicatula TaxID=130591 RepID=UPI003F5163DC